MELRQNRVKRKLQRGERVYVASGFTHADDIDAFGPAGFDGIWIEGEHGAMTFDDNLPDLKPNPLWCNAV